MEDEKQKRFLTLGLRLKLLWLLFSTRRGLGLVRTTIGAISRAKAGDPFTPEEWAAAAAPFCALMSERGLDVEYIVNETKEALKKE